METRPIVVTIVGLVGLLAFASIAGTVADPQANGVSYEVPEITQDVVSASTVSPESPATTGRTGFIDGESLGFWLGPIGMIVILVLWAIGALLIMERPVALVTIVGAVLFAIGYLVTIGPGLDPSTANTVQSQSEMGLLERLLWLLVGLVTVGSSAALLVPDDTETVQKLRLGLRDLPLGLLELVPEGEEGAETPVVTPSNEVYAAWRDLDRQVETSGSQTPQEVERAAIERDLDPAAVHELRRLFEDVRYGGTDPTDERESAARELRERLQSGDSDG